MLSNKESLDQIIVATPGLSSDPIALGKCWTELEETGIVGEGESKRRPFPSCQESLTLLAGGGGDQAASQCTQPSRSGQCP